MHPRSTQPPPVQSRRLALRVGNTTTEVTRADNFILAVVWEDLAYVQDEWLAGEAARQGQAYVGNTWDGMTRLLRWPQVKNPWFPSGLLSRVIKLGELFGYTVEVEDLRRPPDVVISESDRSIVDRDYQLGAVEAALTKGRGVWAMCPRAGKTRSMMEVYRRLRLPTIWTAPTHRIAKQTLDVANQFFPSDESMLLVGTSAVQKASRTNLVICTQATAGNLSPEFYRTRQMFVCDEWHHSASKTVQKNILPKCDHIYYRFGMTGTNFRSGHDTLVLRSLISEEIYSVDSKFLMDRGYLVPTRVAFLPVLSKRLMGVGSSKFIDGHGKKGIHQHADRNQLVAQAAFYALREGRKPLILIGTKDQGYRIKKILESFVPPPPSGCRFGSVEFLSTDRTRPRQQEIIDSYLSDQEVKILMGTSLLGEGVDLPAADCLIYARGEKARVSLTQNVFRVKTCLPGKRDSLLVDFADRHNAKLLAHSKERLRVYYDDPTFDIDVLRSPTEYHQWLTGAPAGAGI